MEASAVVTEQALGDVIDAVAATATPASMFRYSGYLHVGQDAADCEHRHDGTCEDIQHFHAWCRLPNPFQHKDIREKGLAAKARVQRAYKDPESDASVILDSELDTLRDEAFRKVIVDELLMREWGEDLLESQSNVREREEFEHIDQDREEYNRLHSAEGHLPAGEQSEEFRQLDTHMAAYLRAQREEMERLQAPRRAELESRSFDSLLSLLRSKRIEEAGNRAFLDIYNSWMWFVGTYKVRLHETLGRPYLPMWPDIGTPLTPHTGTMFAEAPEVIEALKELYSQLSVALQKGSAGN